MHRIALEQHDIAIEVAEFHEVRAVNRRSRHGGTDVPLLQRNLVDRELGRKEDVAHGRATAVGDDIVVGVADVEVAPLLRRLDDLIVAAVRRRSEGVSTRPVRKRPRGIAAHSSGTRSPQRHPAPGGPIR